MVMVLMFGPFFLFALVQAADDWTWSGDSFAPVTAVVAACGLQTWISFQSLREQPLAWVSAVVQILLCAGAWAWLGASTATLTWFAIATLAMLRPSWWPQIIVGFTLILVAIMATNPDHFLGLSDDQTSVWTTIWETVYTATVFLAGGAALFAATRLVRAVDAIEETQDEISLLATTSERSRIGLDLHDLLGQSLSAISLQGDLAVRLVQSGQHQRAAETVDAIANIARNAASDSGTLTNRTATTTMSSELINAKALFAGADIAFTHPHAHVAASMPPAITELLGWATREGATNVVRHSQATWCQLTLDSDDNRTTMRLLNNGITAAPSGLGSGLTGLAERAVGVEGSVTGKLIDGDVFELVVEVPWCPA